MHPRRTWLIVATIVLLGAGLRWHNLSEWDMWLDEVDTLWIAETGVFTEGPMYSTAPLNFWLTSASVRVFGSNEIGERFPSFLAGVITIALFFVTFRSTLGDRAAILGTLFLCLSMWHVFWSQVGRHFAPQVLFILIALKLLIHYVETGRAVFAWLSAAAMALALATHSSAFFTLIGIVAALSAGWLAARLGGRDNPGRYGRAAIPFFLLVAAYLPVIYAVGNYVMENKVSWNPPYGIVASYLFYVGPVMLFLALAGFLVLIRNGQEIGWLLAGLVAVPMLLLLYSTTRTLSSVPYILASLLPVAALIGVALDWLLEVGRANGLRWAAIAIVTGVYVTSAWDLAHYYLVYNGLKPRWKEALAYVEQRREVNEALFAAEGIVAEFYLGRGEAAWLGFDEVNAPSDPGAWYIEYLSLGPMPYDLNQRYVGLLEKAQIMAVFPLHYGAKNRTLVVLQEPSSGS